VVLAMAEKYYRQCQLRKENVFRVSWLPEQLAKYGQVLRFREGEGWDYGWKVVGVWAREPARIVEKMRDAHRTTRRVSDI